MPTPEQLQARFWKALKSDRTVLLGLVGADESHTRPMTAVLEHDDHGPIWFFSSKDTALVRHLTADGRAVCAFVAKDHALFATIHGRLSPSIDPSVIDRLWNPFIAAWYEGKDDPKLALLRFDPTDGEIWLNDSSFLAGVKMLLGVDPKKGYQDKVAKVRMG
ncbi:MAG TPA: pyridoxamine 5'-phosphate oxidase family protein [Burkholderiaceae bacterium]|nr:pyridoxamine 5'-phosphate oxidase family protein [Burkholderiaceae bacterium]